MDYDTSASADKGGRANVLPGRSRCVAQAAVAGRWLSSFPSLQRSQSPPPKDEVETYRRELADWMDGVSYPYYCQ